MSTIQLSVSVCDSYMLHHSYRLEFPSVLILYQDIIVSIHGINVLTGFVDRRLFCTSEDLVETFTSPASPYCTVSGRHIETIDQTITPQKHLASFYMDCYHSTCKCLTTCVQIYTVHMVNHTLHYVGCLM